MNPKTRTATVIGAPLAVVTAAPAIAASSPVVVGGT